MPAQRRRRRPDRGPDHLAFARSGGDPPGRLARGSRAGRDQRSGHGKTPTRPATRQFDSTTTRGNSPAELALDKGIALSDEGQADRGLLWILEALKTAPGDATAFRQTGPPQPGHLAGTGPQTTSVVHLGIADPQRRRPSSAPTAEPLPPERKIIRSRAFLLGRQEPRGHKLEHLSRLRVPRGLSARRQGLLRPTLADRKRLIAFDVATKTLSALDDPRPTMAERGF